MSKITKKKKKKEGTFMPGQRQCPECKGWFPGVEVTFAPDPYSEEIHNNTTPVLLCAKCRYEAAMDI